MRKVFLFFLTAIFIQSIFAQQQQQQPSTPPPAAQASSFDLSPYGITVEPDRRLIVVMAALEAGGIETSLAPTAGDEFRRRLRADLKNLNPELRQKIKTFVENHKRRRPEGTTPAQLVAPFVSLAYVLSPAPELANPVNVEGLPAELLEVLDFGSIVREFYRNSGIGEKLPEYYNAYRAEGDKLRPLSGKMARELLSYLHTRPEVLYGERVRTDVKDEKDKNKTVQKVSVQQRERRFVVVPDLLAPAGSVIFQNIRDDYFVIVPPNTDLSRSEVRRGYLQFVFDALVLKNAREIQPLQAGIRQLLDARRASRPDVSPDAFLAVSRSLVAAADAREIEFQKVQAATAEARRKIDAAQGVEAKRAVSAELALQKQAFADETALQLSEAYERGAVLAFYFAEQFRGLEDSGFDVSSSLRDMILSLDPAKESARLAQYADARTRAVANRQAARNKNLELPKRLLDINELIVKKNFQEAESELKKLLAENPNEPRIFYNLGRIYDMTAASAFDEELRDQRLASARTYYSGALAKATPQTDPALVQLSYVALGRIYEFYDEMESALKNYDAAIKIGDVQGGAYKEAADRKAGLAKKP